MCAMIVSLLVIFFGKHIVRVENEVVKPTNPPFYKRFVDDVNK